MNEVIENIMKVYGTLNKLDVHGKENLDRLLGCLQTIETVHAKLTELKHDEE